MRWIRSRQESLFGVGATASPGITLREQRQLDVLEEMAAYYGDLPFPELPSAASRYYFDNLSYTRGDAVVLYGMFRRLKPERVIEIGSGFSSAVMLDTDEAFLGGRTRFTFIEPYPERLLGLLKEGDRARCEVIQQLVQNVSLARFEELKAGDILFVDSSHVVKIGSDVRHILSTILPVLRPGVVVHFHDVFWPFEYPREWVVAGRAWNEAYFLHAFLQYNSVFEIEYFNSYMAAVHAEDLERRMPLCMRDPGGGLWLRRAG